MFEKLGWIVLSKERHYPESKIKAYIDSVNHLEQQIKEKIKTTHDQDKINDLNILLENTHILQKHIKKDFKRSGIRSNKRIRSISRSRK